jgi:ribosome-binding factor A
MRRVNESLRKVLADGVERLADPAVGFVTVTGVRATTDFSQAIVYVSVLGSEKRRTKSLNALERAHGVLQQRVARELRLRRTPQLIFQYDETVDRALRMSELIDQVAPAPGTEEQVNEDSE